MPPSQTNSKPSLNPARYMLSSYKELLEEKKVSRDPFELGATFPLRPDVYAATDQGNDLPTRAEDLVTKAPALPYPSLARMNRSLAQNPTVTSPPSSMRSLPIALPLSTSKSTGGLFSSIGRKASAKKGKQPPSPGKTLVKKTRTPPQQKPTQLPPHIIGGPRAIPGRLHIIVAPSVARPEETQKQASLKRRSTVGGKRPPLFPPPSISPCHVPQMLTPTTVITRRCPHPPTSKVKFLDGLRYPTHNSIPSWISSCICCPTRIGTCRLGI